MGTERKFYWLKLQRDFFKRHDIRIVESMPNGKDYVLFYLKLLLESTKEGGVVETNPQRLAELTNSDVVMVRGALETFKKYGMLIEINESSARLTYITKGIIVSRFEITGRDRSIKEYKNWRRAVFERDNYTCQHCKKRGVVLNAHHIIPWSKNEDLRFDVSNGVTLCRECHKKLHRGKIKWKT